MKIDSLKAEAKRLGIRVTKKIKGKRVPLTEKELDMKIQRRQAPALEIQVRQTKKLLRTCRSLFKNMGGVPKPKNKTVTPVRRLPVPPPPPPPVPTRVIKRDPSSNLMTALKANLKKRGIKEKLNQIS
jgi:hypothetical protein